MSTLIATHNNGDLADVEFDFVGVTFLLPNRKRKPAGDAAFCIAVRDTRDTVTPTPTVKMGGRTAHGAVLPFLQSVACS